MSGVIATMGAIFASSSDKVDNDVLVLEPTDDPSPMVKLAQPGKSPVAQVKISLNTDNDLMLVVNCVILKFVFLLLLFGIEMQITLQYSLLWVFFT